MIGVIGAGTMGLGIAIVLSAAGHDVTLVEPDDAVRGSVADRIEGCANEGAAVAPDRIAIASAIEALAGADLVIEAVPELLETKQNLYDAIFSRFPNVIVASNTSTIPPDLLAARLPDHHAANLLVAHFWNPPYLLPLVEIVAGTRTDLATVNVVEQTLDAAGLKPVRLERAVPGFVGNRLQMAVVREALNLVEMGVATPEVIDAVVRYSIGRRYSCTGPLESADLGGLHIFAAVHGRLCPDLAAADEGAALLARKVAAGQLGARWGRGFYDWTPERRAAVARRRKRLMQETLE